MRRTLLQLTCLVAIGCGGEPAPEQSAPQVDSPSTGPARGAKALPGAQPLDSLIVPAMRIGPVERTTSELALVDLLGTERVVRREAHIGEGFCVPGSVVYPGTPGEIEVLWSDSTYQTPAAARVAGPDSRWRTSRGVRVGTPLAELEVLTGGPVEFSGFGWDYGGRASWSELTPRGREEIVLDLAPHPDSVALVTSDPRYPEILGERRVRSDHPLMRRLDVRVERISVPLGPMAPEHQCTLP